MKQSIARLREYVSEDEIYSKYKKKKLTEISDFDAYCIEHCKDIELVLKNYKLLKEKLTKASEIVQKYELNATSEVQKELLELLEV